MSSFAAFGSLDGRLCSPTSDKERGMSKRGCLLGCVGGSLLVLCAWLVPGAQAAPFAPSERWEMALPDSGGGQCWRRRRYWRRRKRRRKKEPKVNRFDVLIKRLLPTGRIDKEKLRLSIEKKLKRIARCYGLVQKQKGTKETPKGRKKRVKRRAKAGSRTYGEVEVVASLNGYGRVTDVSLKRNSFSKRESDCFLWYFRGRKLFPPQGYKKIKVRLRLQVADKRKKRKKKR